MTTTGLDASRSEMRLRLKKHLPGWQLADFITFRLELSAVVLAKIQPD